MGSADVANTTTLPAVRALPDKCNCVHSIWSRRLASPSPAWLNRPAVDFFVRWSLHMPILRTFTILTSPELHACDSARTLDCCALSVTVCETWPVEPHLMPQPPVVAKSCSNPRVHKAEVHYQRGTLVESRPCWQVVPFPSQRPVFPSTSPDEHHPNPEPFLQSSLFQFPQFPQHIHLCET